MNNQRIDTYTAQNLANEIKHIIANTPHEGLCLARITQLFEEKGLNNQQQQQERAD